LRDNNHFRASIDCFLDGLGRVGWIETITFGVYYFFIVAGVRYRFGDENTAKRKKNNEYGFHLFEKKRGMRENEETRRRSEKGVLESGKIYKCDSHEINRFWARNLQVKIISMEELYFRIAFMGSKKSQWPVLKNPTLKTLKINNSSKDHFDSIEKLISWNASLTHLELRENNLEDGTALAISLRILLFAC